MAFGKRIREARNIRGLTQQQLADAIGVEQGTINAIESRDAKTSKYAEALCKALRIDIGWALAGVGESPSRFEVRAPSADYDIQLDSVGSFETWDDNTPLGADEVALPFYKEVAVSAGGGRSCLTPGTSRKLRFSKRTLQNANVQIKDAITMKVNGDSMERLIMDGATIGVDTSKALEPIKDNRIYALETSGMLRCKYLQRLPGDKIKVYSENKMYDDEIYDMEEFSALYRIIGGVFWWSTLERW